MSFWPWKADNPIDNLPECIRIYLNVYGLASACPHKNIPPSKVLKEFHKTSGCDHFLDLRLMRDELAKNIPLGVF